MKKILLLIICIFLGGIGAIVYINELPSTDGIDPLTYFTEFSQDQMNVTFEDIRLSYDNTVIVKDDIIYVSSEFAKKYIDDRIFYDAEENILTITNLEQIIRMYLDDLTYTINGEPHQLSHAIFEQDEKAYIPISYIEANYPFSFSMGNDGRLVLASDLTNPVQLATVTAKKQAYLRTHPEKKALVVDVVYPNEVLEVYGTLEDYTRVRNSNGMIGLIATKDIELIGTRKTQTHQQYYALPSKNPLNESVKLVWDQIGGKTAGDWTSYTYTTIDGANVISPTWFDFADENGKLADRGHAQYVVNAHNHGLQVWPIFAHTFTQPQYTRQILTSTAKRQYVIDQLIDYSLLYNLDGINVDIENIQEDFSEEWVQFMRELYPQLKEIGVTVSVDIYVPSPWSMHYHRDKVAEVVDYFMVMAYDQHWSGSEQAGPVASIPWVRESVEATLEQVPVEKLVLGIPFFNRIWAETEDEKLETRATSMYEINTILRTNNITKTYDPFTELNYVEYWLNNKLYKIWIEDAEAIAKRVEIIDTYNLAGYAGWRVGLETPDVWEHLSKIK
ncbi:MAG: hypothetical protein ATN35_09000 [Epulopiscium sp. Nele67-Bin004]|nr:MAG: hypothetical protein ATN35_09000 [Epulopiscium sp. Nele67-Bin004]